MATYVRGVLTTITGMPVGYLQSISATSGAEIHHVRDNLGITRKHDLFDHSGEFRAVVKLEANSTVEVGDVLTIAACRATIYNGNYRVQPGSNFGEENMDSPVVELVLLRFIDGNIPAS